MKVLVTGGCGFLGSHVCELFIRKGWKVIAYDNLTKFEYSRIPYLNTDKVRNYNLDYLEKLGVTVIIDDIKDLKTLFKATSKCNYIIHTAAQPAMTIAKSYPLLDFETNVQGTLNVLECAREHNIPMVNCSTIHVYGNGINEKLIEEEDRFYMEGSQSIGEGWDILTGDITPLHASKVSAENYVRAYTDTYGLNAATFRLTGMYGPRQFGGEDHGWVANFAIRTILGLPIKVFGTDKQVRDILYVKDAARAFYDWFSAGCPSGTYNIGGGIKCILSIRECLEMLRDITGKEQNIRIEPPRMGDLYYFCCDTYRAKSYFGWTPRIIPQLGLRYMVNWLKRNMEVFSV